MLAAEILGRGPRSWEDHAILADLALTYDADQGVPGEGAFASPGAFSTATHIGRLALALSQMAPRVEFWSINHEYTPKQRSELFAAAA